jgi:hypothetical protein
VTEKLEWDSEDLDFDSPIVENEIPTETEDEPIADIPGYDAIFGAPDYAEIVGKKQTGKSRTYERKVQSVEKALVIGSLKRNNFPDAAAILKNGPAFARAVGDAAAENKRVAGYVDMITAPDNPMVVLAIASIGLLGQLVRNHQPQIEAVRDEVRVGWKRRRELRKSGVKLVNEKEPIATSTFKLPFRKRPITIKWRFKLPLVGVFSKGIMGASIDPAVLSYTVFSDPDVLVALEKQGITVGVRDPNV